MSPCRGLAAAGLLLAAASAYGASEPESGKSIWLANCEGCHGIGVAGAPAVTDMKAWAPRLLKNRSELYEHALEGFFGPRGTMMPARGGNDSLSDDEVRAAVDHMVHLVESAEASKPKRK